jgi:hypothetical protein
MFLPYVLLIMRGRISANSIILAIEETPDLREPGGLCICCFS